MKRGAPAAAAPCLGGREFEVGCSQPVCAKKRGKCPHPTHTRTPHPAPHCRCGRVTSEYAKTFYLGTQLMTAEKARAIWAIYVWCRRTDELVDGPNASRITPAVSLTFPGPFRIRAIRAQRRPCPVCGTPEVR